MGNRYLWSQYDLESVYRYDYNAVSNKIVRIAVSSSSNPSYSNYQILAMADRPDPVGRNRWTYTGKYKIGRTYMYTDDYPYCIVLYTKASSSLINSLLGKTSISTGTFSGTLNIDFNIIGGSTNSSLIWGGDYIYWSIMTAAKTWEIDKQAYTGSSSGYEGEVILVCSSSANSSAESYRQGFEYLYTTLEYNKGDKLGYRTSSSSSAYPSNDYRGGYWYEYAYYSGNRYDNIDPTAISIPDTINANDYITVTITPNTAGNANSGMGTNTYYTYEYKFGSSGSWTQFQRATTSTTATLQIPAGTKSVQVRARASDTLGFTSTTYVTSQTVEVINNYPPSAPDSITVTGVQVDQEATITITEATDTDGYITNYYWERSIDGGSFTQIQETTNLVLSIKDQISADWGTVTYRVRAKDDYGEYGDYATSTTYEVQEGVLMISTPSYNLGEQISPFYFIFQINVTGTPSDTSVHVDVYLDGRPKESKDTNFATDISIPIDPRLLSATTHTITITAEKEGYTTAQSSNVFYISGITAPNGGVVEQLQNPAGQTVLPMTLGQCVIGRDGKDMNTIIEEVEAAQAKVYSGSYVGTGTYGSGSPNTISVQGTPKMAFIAESGSSSGLMWGGSPTVGNVTFNAVDGNLTWYASSASAQYNTTGTNYYYMILV